MFHYNIDFSNSLGQQKKYEKPTKHVIFEQRVQNSHVSQNFWAFRFRNDDGGAAAYSLPQARLNLRI